MEVTNLMLLGLFRQCSHIQFHRQTRFRGQARILTLLEERGRMSQKELTGLLQRRSATLSEQLENMEKSGYIVRQVNPLDRRNLEITLTQEGIAAAGEARKERQETANELFGVLGKEEKEQLYPILEKLLAAWQEGEKI